MDSSYIIASRTRKIKRTVQDRFGEPRICVQNVPLHDDKDDENEDETIKTDDRRNIDPEEDEDEDKKEQEDKDEDTVQKVPINSNSNCKMVKMRTIQLLR